MEKLDTENALKNGVNILLPVQIKLKVLEKKLQEELIGFEVRKDGEDDGTLYGEVLAANLHPGTQGYDLNLELEILTKTKLFKNKKLKIDLQLKLNFNQQKQAIDLEDYKATGENNSWFTNKLIGFLLNSLIRKKVLEKSNFHLEPKLKKAKTALNKKLENLFEVKKGVLLYGNMQELFLQEVYVKEKHLIILLAAQGDLAAEIFELNL